MTRMLKGGHLKRAKQGRRYGNKEIKIEYDGAYPNLCGGSLTAYVDGKKYNFPDYCLISGGPVSFDGEWNGQISKGEWSVSEWPKDMPDDIKDSVLDAIKKNISHGCCGGCV